MGERTINKNIIDSINKFIEEIKFLEKYRKTKALSI